MTIAPKLTCKPIPEVRRAAFARRMFGPGFSRSIEPVVYAKASMLSPDCKGGMWVFARLPPCGFFMFPDADAEFRVFSPNSGFHPMSSEAFGITACLLAFSDLVSTGCGTAEVCADRHHELRQHALVHPERTAILSVTDQSAVAGRATKD